jgi:pyridoxal biosynthesis lyase PdxS
MRSIRVMLSLVLLMLAVAVYAQTDAQKPQTDAQKSFEILKSLAGTWEGPVIMDAQLHEHAKGAPERVQVALRVTSRGNALVHEMGEMNRTDDPTKYDHPVTMFYLQDGKLMLTHFCDAGNRPRMTAKVAEDGKTIEFDFLDVSGSTQYGHMQHAVFTIIDANHHIEEWTFKLPGEKTMGGRLDLQRVKPQQASAR